MMFLGYILITLAVLSQVNAEGHCVTRGSCGYDEVTGLSTTCEYNGNALPLNDKGKQRMLTELCPSLKTGPEFAVCCDATQVDQLNTQFAALATLFQRCPSCYHNLANLFCQMVCSPNQSLFLQVTDSKNSAVHELSYYITENYATGMFDSCKNVKLADTSYRAIEIACGEHSTDCTPHLWLQYIGGHDPSPYQINFHYQTSDIVTVNDVTYFPMNETVIPCSQPVSIGGASCSIKDCSSNSNTPTSPQKIAEGHCVARGSCGVDELTGMNKMCVYNGPALPLNDEEKQGILTELCPSLNTGPGFAVCCDAAQVDLLNYQLVITVELFKSCPSCYHNLANVFCQMMCSTNQSLFLQVTESTNNSVDEMSYYITENYATGMFDSCKNVKIADTPIPAMEMSCGEHSANCTPHLLLEFLGGHNPSPQQINFHYETSDSVTINDITYYPMNDTVIPCSQAVKN